MSIAAKLQGWLTFSGRRQVRLLAEARVLAVGILPPDKVDSYKSELSNHSGRLDGKERWKSWRWLIDTHHTAREQTELLRDCLNLVDRAAAVRFKKGEENSKGQFHRDLIDTFKEPLKLESDGVTDLKKVKSKLECRLVPWSKLLEDVRKERPPVFVSHAFLRLSDSTGLEIASLFVAGLIGLGAVYMAFFYATATGQAPNAYWTLDDLIIQGVLVLPQIGLVLITVEVVFAFVRRRRGYNSYRWHGVIMKRPFVVAAGFFLVMSVLLAVDGHRRGAKKLDDFVKTMDNKVDRQMATVLDRTVLNNVYLVGTTDRTAIFLQLKEADGEVGTDVPSFFKAACFVLSSFGGSGSCDDEDPANHRVLVMDRALVVCHAKMDECDRPGPDDEGNDETDEIGGSDANDGKDESEGNGGGDANGGNGGSAENEGNDGGNGESEVTLELLEQQLAGIDGRIESIGEWSVAHDGLIRTEFSHVATHINRHLNHVAKAIGEATGLEVDLPEAEEIKPSSDGDS